ncbi:MAG: response regulator transcription factor [Oscillospiraceae bacterium]|jgi:two-component system alkaline phosphatase synthesis response regulator PhoP|nr:response regulator transcription factor [Oscillospiraceae bacterium]
MIFCVEDDDAIRGLMMYALNAAGFEARGLTDGTSLFDALRTERPQLILLDIMLPGEDGISILKKLRGQPSTAGLPVIMATAKGTEYDKVNGLDLGADDYLAKPFGMMEMVSRVKAVLRRYSPKQEKKKMAVGGLEIDLEQRTATADGERIPLTYKEFELLRLFLARPGMAFTREQLLSEVWGIEYCGETRTVDMHIRTLRQKLGSYGAMIETVRNVGYRMEARQ